MLYDRKTTHDDRHQGERAIKGLPDQLCDFVFHGMSYVLSWVGISSPSLKDICVPRAQGIDGHGGCSPISGMATWSKLRAYRRKRKGTLRIWKNDRKPAGIVGAVPR